MRDAPLSQKQALLDLLEQGWKEACRTTLDQANKQAEEIVKTAEEEARQRKKAAQAAEQWRRARVLEATQAQQATELRQLRLNNTKTLLEKGFVLLEQALVQCWQNEANRRRWLLFLLDRAHLLLPEGNWEVIHPTGWNPQEIKEIGDTMATRDTPSLTFRAETSLTAGVRMGCRGAWVDGTLHGITANRQEIEAMLLALLEPHGSGSWA